MTSKHRQSWLAGWPGCKGDRGKGKEWVCGVVLADSVYRHLPRAAPMTHIIIIGTIVFYLVLMLLIIVMVFFFLLRILPCAYSIIFFFSNCVKLFVKGQTSIVKMFSSHHILQLPSFVIFQCKLIVQLYKSSLPTYTSSLPHWRRCTVQCRLNVMIVPHVYAYCIIIISNRYQ